MAQTKPKAGQFYGVSNNGTDGEFLQTDGAGGMAWASTIADPTITSIDYPGSTTAALPAGGESVIINGTLFASGITCTVGGTSAVTAFNSATQITITTPAKAAGPYTVAVTNTNGGTASQASFIQYSGVPVWSTASGTLGNVLEGTSASFQVTATEGSDTIEYAVTTGTLPTGLSLATATGAVTGTAGSVSASTTTTFSITATDDENQTSSARSFNITVTPDIPSNHFNTVLYNGNGSATQAITGVGFEAGFTWIKCRTSAQQNGLFDTIRGTNEWLHSDSNAAQTTYSGNYGLLSWASDGFTVGNGSAANASGQSYVAWNFKAGGTAVANTDGDINSQVSVNNTLGFSIVSYTGSSTLGNTIGHGLDSAPDLIICKKTTGTANWAVWSSTFSSASETLFLDLTSPSNQYINRFGTVTSTTFQAGSSGGGEVNPSGGGMIAYCFTSKPGFSKLGSYTGNGSANGPMVQTGFEPAFVMLKGAVTSNATNWWIFDNKRNPTNPLGKGLIANLSAAEQAQGTYLDFYSNGFAILSGNGEFNNTGDTYIYLAFAADGSTATPSLANSFATELYTGNGGTQSVTTGFKPDFTWVKARNVAYDHGLVDSVRGTTSLLYPDLAQAASTGVTNAMQSFDSNGFTWGSNNKGNASGTNYVSWNLKAGGTPSINTDGTITSIVSANQAAGFSIVKFTSPFNGQTAGHGLSSTPEMIILKIVNSSAAWYVWTPALTSGNSLALNDYRAQNTDVAFTVNSTTFTTNFSNTSYEYIAYCFTSISGYSKVGSYTSNNTSLTINVGFTPGLVLIKNIDTSGGSWNLFDSKRANGSSLWANTSRADADYSSLFQLNSTGFVVNGQNTNTNNLTDEFLYLAIKEN